MLTRLAILSTLFALAKAEAFTSDGTRIIAGYEPKIALSVVGIVLYGLAGTVHWIHWWRNRNNRFLLTLTIGMTCMVLGFILRVAYNSALDSIGVYAIMTLFILLSPCAFLATNYMLLTRLARALNAESALFIRASIVTKLFVWCDVFTFLLQGAGGGLSSQPTSADLGHKIALVGIAVQLASYCLFTLLLIYFGFKAPRKFPQIKEGYRQHSTAHRDSYSPFATTPLHNWKNLWYLLLITSVGIIVRSAFRLAEYTQGYYGYLPTHEGYFYLLDALPLWLAMTLYCFFWPSRFIRGSEELIQIENLNLNQEDVMSMGTPNSGNHELRLKEISNYRDGHYA
ncbi:hypothetical protein JCM3765_003399 [Sporobolomyces pararoseus]